MARGDVRRLTKAIRDANATQFQLWAAATLLGHTGIDNALGYVAGIKRRNEDRQQPRLFEEES